MSDVLSTTSPPGLDLENLSIWMKATLAEPAGPLAARMITGGRSNLTYFVSDGVENWVVRRHPLGHVLESAHDMSREFRAMSALQGTDVPVPRTLAFCDDESVIGSPFYAMEYVPGTVYRTKEQLDVLGPERVKAISGDLVDTLVKLHAVSPSQVGLDTMGKAEGFLARQVRRWGQQLDNSHSRDIAGVAELRALLNANVPSESNTGIVHGDYSLGNTLVGGDHIAAVLDWEMATIGDPLTDLALMVLYHRLGHHIEGETVSTAACAQGFLTESEVIDRYNRLSTRDLSNFAFYLGLASFKLATILEGIHYRYLQGQTVGDGYDVIGDVVPPLVEMGLTYMKEYN